MSKNYMPLVVAVAIGEVGYKEKKSLKDLFSKSDNAGSANYNKYAYEIDKKYPDFYNGKKNGYSWCDVFVDWCFITAYGVENALCLLCQPEKSSGAGCTYSMRYYIKANRFFAFPQVGDQVFFGEKGDLSTSTHTGLVVKVDDKKIYTVEGNKSNKVKECSYKRSDSTIIGYGRPDYDSEPLPSTYPTTRKGDKGEDVKYVQSALITLGYDCGSYGADGDFGTKTDAAVRKFQKNNALAVDGIVGIKTKTAIYNCLERA